MLAEFFLAGAAIFGVLALVGAVESAINYVRRGR